MTTPDEEAKKKAAEDAKKRLEAVNKDKVSLSTTPIGDAAYTPAKATSDEALDTTTDSMELNKGFSHDDWLSLYGMNNGILDPGFNIQNVLMPYTDKAGIINQGLPPDLTGKFEMLNPNKYVMSSKAGGQGFFASMEIAVEYDPKTGHTKHSATFGKDASESMQEQGLQIMIATAKREDEFKLKRLMGDTSKLNDEKIKERREQVLGENPSLFSSTISMVTSPKRLVIMLKAANASDPKMKITLEGHAITVAKNSSSSTPPLSQDELGLISESLNATQRKMEGPRR